MKLSSMTEQLGRFEKLFMNARRAPIIHNLLVLLLLSSLVLGYDDGVSVCSFKSLAADTATSIADCNNRNTLLNNLPEASKRLRYDPFPELFSADAVESFKRYSRFKREKSDTVDSKNKQHVDKNKKPIRKSPRIQEWDPDDGMKCIDLSAYSTVIDFSCIYTFPSEVLHHTYDCFVGNYELFNAAQNHDNNSTILIVPYEETNQANMMPFVDFFLPKKKRQAAVVTHRYMKLGADYHDLGCFIVNSKAKVIYTNLEALWLDFYAFDQFPPSHPRIVHMMNTAQRFRKAIQTATKTLELQKSTGRTILFIHRSENRILSNSDAIVKAINDAVTSTQLHGQLRTTTFYGNETFVDTVLLFQQASVVVAFHGAGLVNTLYCSNDAIIVELSIALLTSDQKPKDNDVPPIWRSNHVIGTLCQLHWVTYLLRPTDYLVRLDKEKHGFLFQLDLHTITMLQTDITRLATIIKTKMLAIFSKSSSPSSSVSTQSQGSYEVFTGNSSDTITPMKLIEKSDNPSKQGVLKPPDKGHQLDNPSKQGALKPLDKNHQSDNPSKQSALKPLDKGHRHDHDGPPVGRKQNGEKKGQTGRKKTVLKRETNNE